MSAIEQFGKLQVLGCPNLANSSWIYDPETDRFVSTDGTEIRPSALPCESRGRVRSLPGTCAGCELHRSSHGAAARL